MSTLRSLNPYTRKEVISFPELTKNELHKKIMISHEAFLAWRKTTFDERRVKMMKVSELLKDRRDELAGMITAEMGKLLGESRSEVEKCAWVCSWYAEHAESFLATRTIETDAQRSMVVYQPLGPVLAVMPWNFPFWQVFRFAAPALMAGNTALLKHASNVQGSAAMIESLFRDAGFAEGAFTNLAIGSSLVSQVIASPEVRAVTLTGSESAGAAVAAEAGRNLKKTVLELGGSNPFVVLKDADIPYAVEVAMKARLQNAGQSCIAAKRFIIDEHVYDRFMELLLEKVGKLRPGDPADELTSIATLSSPEQAQEVERQVKDTVKAGAELVTGGTRDFAYFEPTILTGVEPGMAVFDEETFGPVFAVTKSSGEAQALALANSSGFGLGMQVFTGSGASAELFMHEANEGAVFVNGMVKSDPRLPFGGVKRSGYGRELSWEGIREFVNVKTIWEDKLKH